MAVLWVHELWNGRRDARDYKDAVSYVRVFQVRTDSNMDGPSVVEEAQAGGQLPDFGAYYTDGNGRVDKAALLSTVEPDNHPDDPTVWFVRCTYSTDVYDDPTDEPPDIDWSVMHEEEALQQDIEGTDIVNSAGDPYDPPPTVHKPVLVLKYQRNELTYPAGLATLYSPAINYDPFQGRGAGFALCVGISGRMVWTDPGEWAHFRVHYEFHFRKEKTWDLKLLDAGFRKISGSGLTARLVPILAPGFGNQVTKAALLDGSGGQLAYGGTPVYRPPFKPYSRLPFNVLNIPDCSVCPPPRVRV